MSHRYWCALAALLLVFGIRSAAAGGGATRPAVDAAARYEVINLGTLGGDLSGASAINSRGQVAGAAQIPNAKPHYFWHDRYSHPFRWQDGVMRDLGMPPGGKKPTAYVHGLNSRGDVVGSIM